MRQRYPVQQPLVGVRSVSVAPAPPASVRSAGVHPAPATGYPARAASNNQELAQAPQTQTPLNNSVAPQVQVVKDGQRALAAYLRKLDLGTAQATPLMIENTGNVLWMKGDRTTTSQSVVFVQFDDPNGPLEPFKYGESLRGRLWRRLYLTWAQQAGEALYLCLFFDDRISSFYPY